MGVTRSTHKCTVAVPKTPRVEVCDVSSTAACRGAHEILRFDINVLLSAYATISGRERGHWMLNGAAQKEVGGGINTRYVFGANST